MKIKSIIAIISVVILTAACNKTYTDSGSEDDLTNNQASSMTQGDVSPMSLDATYAYSFEDLNKLILMAKMQKNGQNLSLAFSNDDIERLKPQLIDEWNLDELDYFYAPSWLPSYAKLDRIMIKDIYASIDYRVRAGESNSSDDDISNFISFVMYRSDNGATVLKNYVGVTRSKPYNSSAAIFTNDIDVISNPGVPVLREYWWLQDGNPCQLDIPIWVLEKESFDPETQAAAVEVSTKAYTVSFDSQGGGTVDPVLVTEGGALAKPDDPIRECYNFTGWYADQDLTTLWDFSTPVGSDITLYAGWDAVVPQSIRVTSAAQTLNMKVGTKMQLIATITPENALDKSVTWSSSNPNVATVSSDTGLVTALLTGSVRVTAKTSNGLSTMILIMINA